MKSIHLTNSIMHDGSRHFLSIPEPEAFTDFYNRLQKQPGIKVVDLVTDYITEVWIDFTFFGHEFSINNQMGEFWFFVKDPNCPDNILYKVASHCQSFLSNEEPER